MPPRAPADDNPRTITLEAFADTIVPGEKRHPCDLAVAGAAEGAGAVQAGAIELLEWNATGVTEGLDDYARLLGDHARDYAAEHGLTLDDSVPPFVDSNAPMPWTIVQTCFASFGSDMIAEMPR